MKENFSTGDVIINQKAIIYKKAKNIVRRICPLEILDFRFKLISKNNTYRSAHTERN